MSTTTQHEDLSPGTHYVTVHAKTNGVPIPVIDGRHNRDYQFNTYGTAQNTVADIKQHPDEHVTDIDVNPNDLIVELHTYTL